MANDQANRGARGGSSLLLAGVASTMASAVVEDPAMKDRIENAIEWNLGVLFTIWFLALAWLWRREAVQFPPAKNLAPPPPRSG